MSSTVLVCDDAVFMRTMVSDILSQAGFTVVGEAENGKQAVEKYQQLKPDLVTMVPRRLIRPHTLSGEPGSLVIACVGIISRKESMSQA